MEKKILLLLSLTLMSAICQAQVDSIDDKARAYGLVVEPRSYDVLQRLKRDTNDDENQGTLQSNSRYLSKGMLNVTRGLSQH